MHVSSDDRSDDRDAPALLEPFSHVCALEATLVNRGNGNAASADQVLAQLRSMQSEIDEIRQKKRALTPPEKVAGSLNL